MYSIYSIISFIDCFANIHLSFHYSIKRIVYTLDLQINLDCNSFLPICRLVRSYYLSCNIRSVFFIQARLYLSGILFGWDSLARRLLLFDLLDIVYLVSFSHIQIKTLSHFPSKTYDQNSGNKIEYLLCKSFTLICRYYMFLSSNCKYFV